MSEPAGKQSPDQVDLVAIENRHSSGAYAKRPVVMVKGQGASLWDAEGHRYIDCMSGLGVANVGHNHPHLVAAVSTQLERLMVCGEAFYNDQRALFLKELTALTPGDLNRVFLCNSGAEAIESAIKVARFLTGRSEIVAFKRGYHGRTMGALSLTWNPRYRAPFHPLLPGMIHVPFNNIEELERAMTGRTAAVVLELIQGEGGIWLAEPDFLRQVRQLCDQRQVLLVVDEVQTGLGRTGKIFAIEHYGVQPDIMCLGKALGGGIPIGAVIWRDKFGPLSPGSHGSTFGGNPIACAAGLAVLQILAAERLPERAARLGRIFMDQLRSVKLPIIREVRGMGLMVGVDLRLSVDPVIKALMNEHILAAYGGKTVIRLLPPLVIPEVELSQVVAAITKVLTDISRGIGHAA